jgi:hypothetical protein
MDACPVRAFRCRCCLITAQCSPPRFAAAALDATPSNGFHSELRHLLLLDNPRRWNRVRHCSAHLLASVAGLRRRPGALISNDDRIEQGQHRADSGELVEKNEPADSDARQADREQLVLVSALLSTWWS